MGVLPCGTRGCNNKVLIPPLLVSIAFDLQNKHCQWFIQGAIVTSIFRYGDTSTVSMASNAFCYVYHYSLCSIDLWLPLFKKPIQTSKLLYSTSSTILLFERHLPCERIERIKEVLGILSALHMKSKGCYCSRIISPRNDAVGSTYLIVLVQAILCKKQLEEYS